MICNISNNTSAWWICVLRMNGVSDHHLSLLFWNHLGTTSDGPALFSLSITLVWQFYNTPTIKETTTDSKRNDQCKNCRPAPKTNRVQKKRKKRQRMNEIQFRVNLFFFRPSYLPVFTLCVLACLNPAVGLRDGWWSMRWNIKNAQESVDVLCLSGKKWEQKSARQTFSLRQRHEGINEDERNQLFLFPHHRQRKEFNSFVYIISELLVIFLCDFERGLFDHADSPITISLTAISL